MFAIGDEKWPGISKLMEEAGEVIQACAKLLATGGEEQHWDGSNLRERIRDEMADLQAAILLVCDLNFDDEKSEELFAERVAKKLERFQRWHELGLTNLLTLRDVACVVCAQAFSDERPRASASETICASCHEAGK